MKLRRLILRSTKTEVDDTIAADLRNRSQPPAPDVLSDEEGEVGGNLWFFVVEFGGVAAEAGLEDDAVLGVSGAKTHDESFWTNVVEVVDSVVDDRFVEFLDNLEDVNG